MSSRLSSGGSSSLPAILRDVPTILAGAKTRAASSDVLVGLRPVFDESLGFSAWVVIVSVTVEVALGPGVSSLSSGFTSTSTTPSSSVLDEFASHPTCPLAMHFAQRAETAEVVKHAKFIFTQREQEVSERRELL